MSAPARDARAAGVAAAIATVGDLLLLYVANSARPELGLPQVGRVWLWIGGALGVLAIPFYAIGYRAAARIVARGSARAAGLVFATGAVASAIGAVIHGVTARQIARALDAGEPGADPLASLMGGGPLLPALWGLAAILVLVASVGFAWIVGRGRAAVPRTAALATPASLTLVLGAGGLALGLLGQAFLTPAAPNLAHVVFFGVSARLIREPGHRPRV